MTSGSGRDRHVERERVESWMEVRKEHVLQGQEHVIDCLLCDLNVEPVPAVPQSAKVCTPSRDLGNEVASLTGGTGLCVF